MRIEQGVSGGSPIIAGSAHEHHAGMMLQQLGSYDDGGQPSKSMGAILRAIQETLIASLARAIPRGSRVALIDYPRHTNVGDSAIWLGERKLLHHIGARVVYLADMSQYDSGRMRSLLGDGIVLIHGGGNFGDLWPSHQAFRERVLADFPDNTILQLPQSIHFDDQANAARVKKAIARHRRFTLFVRDRQSLAIARDRLGIEALLAPDSAFGLWPLQRIGRPNRSHVIQRRTDKELASSDPVADSFDWLTPPGRIESKMDKQIPNARRLMRYGPLGAAMYGAWLDRLALLRVRRGLRLLSRGEVVITDRLHGALLSLLADIPVVALDNRTGKISAVLQTWLDGAPGLALANTVSEAVRLAEQMRFHRKSSNHGCPAPS